MVENGIFVENDGNLPNLEETAQIEEAQKRDETLNGLIGQIKPDEYDGFLGFGHKSEPEPVVGDGRQDVDYNGEPIITNTIQYVERNREPDFVDQRKGSGEQAIRINRNNAKDPTNTTKK